jgi:hypothetical protein
MPDFLAFRNEPESKFFLAMGAAKAGIAELTQFPEAGQEKPESASSRAA